MPAQLEQMCLNNGVTAIPNSDTEGIIQRVLTTVYGLTITGQIARGIKYLDATEYILLPRTLAVFIFLFNLGKYPRLIDPIALKQ